MKLENILLDSEGHVVLTDFGLSKEFVTDDVSLAVSVSRSPLPCPQMMMMMLNTYIPLFNQSSSQSD